MAEPGLRRLSFLGMVFSGYLLGSAIPIHAAEVQPPTPGGVSVSDLEGIWEKVDEFHTDDCTTLILTISALKDSQKQLEKFRADESIRCEQGGEFILHYDGTLLKNNAKFFISLNPTSENPVERKDSDISSYSYYPDRLTLWLSGNGCKLAGSREDARRPIKAISFLTVQKRGCS